MQYGHNLSPEETYRLTGTLRRDQIEELLNTGTVIATVRDQVPILNDAACLLPDEDFLEDVMDKVRALMERTRGDNKKAAQEILEQLGNIQSAQGAAAVEASHHIGKVMKTLEQL